jgi:uncharacterized membrane protein
MRAMFKMRLSPAQYNSQVSNNHRPLAMWVLVTAAALGVVALIVAAPFALANGHESIALTLYRTFNYLCHQIPARSFFAAGHPLAVCSRCTGIYAGFFVATICYPLLRSLRDIQTPPRKWLFIAVAPLAIDFSVEFFGIWNNTHLSRFLTGALLGATAVFYVLPGLIDLSLREWRGARPTVSTSPKVPESPDPSLPSGLPSAPSDYSAPHRRI